MFDNKKIPKEIIDQQEGQEGRKQQEARITPRIGLGAFARAGGLSTLGTKKKPKGEIDTFVKPPVDLEDTADVINTYINAIIDEGREKHKGITNQYEFGEKLVEYVFSKVADSANGTKSPIEEFIEGLNEKQIYNVEQKDTKYKGLNYRVWRVLRFIKPDVISPVMYVNGLYIGGDKFGHFFKQGHEYYDIFTQEDRRYKDPEEYGDFTEKEHFGLGYESNHTDPLEKLVQAGGGVYSNADREANRTGMNFYMDLAADPQMKFDIRDYITKDWNEEYNRNFYRDEIAPHVWENILQTTWTGYLFDKKSSSIPFVLKFDTFYDEDSLGDELSNYPKQYSDIQGLDQNASYFEGSIAYEDDDQVFHQEPVCGTVNYVFNERLKEEGYNAVENIEIQLKSKTNPKVTMHFISSSEQELIGEASNYVGKKWKGIKVKKSRK